MNRIKGIKTIGQALNLLKGIDPRVEVLSLDPNEKSGLDQLAILRCLTDCSKLSFTKIIALLLAFAFLTACEKPNFVPKPIAYPRIILPEFSSYQMLSINCPYEFEYPNYVEIEKDSMFFNEKIISDCWINMVYPSINAKVHFSYKEIGIDISLDKVLEDSHELAYTHTKKADFIDEYEIGNKNGVQGLMIEIGGDAANNLQFYLTDYEKHYLRGAVYFETHPNSDSIQPALQFVREDMLHVFETFNWK